MGAKITPPPKKKKKKSLGLQREPKKSLNQNFKIFSSKNPMPNFRAIKISRGTAPPRYVGTITNLQITYLQIEYPKKSVLKSSYPKKYLPKFSYPKKFRNRKFQSQKILRSSLSLEIRTTPLPGHTRPGTQGNVKMFSDKGG